MHDKRNFILILALIGTVIWAFVAWFVLISPIQGAIATVFTMVLIGMIFYALKLEDKLPDHLREVVGDVYYESDGLCFMPIVRANNGHAELSIYYQNRFENPACAIVHLRPPADSFVIKQGMRDAHFAFRTLGGAFGVIHQPISVPRHLQGEIVNVQLAAAAYYPRSTGTRLRKSRGMPCGTLDVDWAGAAFKSGVHQASGEIELRNPATMHLSMPMGVARNVDRLEWKQELLEQGVSA